MMGKRRRWAGRCRGNGGFTMVEVLVAFTVLATLTLAVQRGLSASISSTARADERLGMELTVRTLMSMPLSAGLADGQPLSGTMNGCLWTIRFEPVELPVAAVNVIDGKPPAWRPVRMLISVSTRSGPNLQIETIRLAGG